VSDTDTGTVIIYSSLSLWYSGTVIIYSSLCLQTSSKHLYNL